jgi:tRNA pseudouridine38-40 synthase
VTTVQRLKFLIAYDGRPFEGWQSQARGNTVQDHIERALQKICGARVIVHGSGRTDTGVHALGQVAHADIPAGRLSTEKWTAALNGHLPGEIRVLRTTRAPSSFHARFQARGKIYVYRIWNAAVFHPLERGRAWHLPGPLDLDTLRACARMLEGTHDFGGFAANRRGATASSSVRTVRRIKVRRRGALLTLHFEADGFLYKMVRLMTGTIVRCAQGKMESHVIKELLAGKGARKTSFAAPPDGLYLARVFY